MPVPSNDVATFDTLIVEYSLKSSGDDITYTYTAYDVPAFDYDTLNTMIADNEFDGDGTEVSRDDVTIVDVTDGDGRTLTRDVSMALYNGLHDDALPFTVEDVDGVIGDSRIEYNAPPTGDYDAFTLYMHNGTEFKVTVERTR